MSRHNTPFIPPMNTPEGSPSSPPVIPGGGSPNMSGWGPSATQGGHPVYPAFQSNSPYTQSPYIPASPYTQPGVIPGQTHSRNSSRQGGLSSDWTGYPQGTPYTSPTFPPPGGGTPLTSPHAPPSHPNSPWYPPSAPGPYPAFGGTPWPAQNQPLPPGPPGPPHATPWGMPPRGLPPQGPPGGGYTPAWGAPPPLHSAGGPPPGAYTPAWGVPPPLQPAGGGWGIPPPQQQNTYFSQQDHGGWGGFFGGPPQAPAGGRAPPEPPGQIFDRMDPFMEGNSYGPVLTPFLIRIVDAKVKLNPLISPLPDDGSDAVHLNWNMLYPTSTVQRSTDPKHVSWWKGRDAPATFPRVTELHIISETIPWMFKVKAKDTDKGVTCAEVIDNIGRDLNRHTSREDFESLSIPDRNELKKIYKHNRSTHPSVPGGVLGEGMKRLDFLKMNTMFGGVEVNERVVKRMCGDMMPCVFVLKCSRTFPMSKKELEDQERRMGGNSRAASSKARSRGNSISSRITVQSPSEDSGGSDEEGVDR